MVDFDNSQRAVPAKFSRGAIFASMFLAAVPVLTYVSVFLTVSEPHREIVDINAYPWSSDAWCGTLNTSDSTIAGKADIDGPIWKVRAGRMRISFF